jgi:polar amino acid transport system permease protein
VSVISTLLVIGIIGAIVVNLPTWPRVQEAFFNADVAARAAPKILAAFARNVMLFLLAEVFVLILGLVVAVLRSLKGPVFTPIRGFAIIYVDVFRACPASSSSTYSASACRPWG